VTDKSFLDRVLAGEITDPAVAIDDAIEAWHADKRAEGELHEYLGMTWEEYTAFVAKPSTLTEIIAARQRGCEQGVCMHCWCQRSTVWWICCRCGERRRP
jgi:hypothetical protein